MQAVLYNMIREWKRQKRRFGSFLFLFVSVPCFVFADASRDTSLAAEYMQQALQLHDSSEYKQAIHYYRRAADIYESGDYWKAYVKTLNHIADNYITLSAYDKALAHLDTALSAGIRHLGASHPEVANAYDYTGLCYENKGDPGTALRHFHQALNIRLRVYSDMHPKVAMSYNNIGVSHASRGQYDTALAYFQKALFIRIKVESGHARVATSHQNIGFCYYKKGYYDKALHYYQQALQIRLKLFGRLHPDVALSYISVGSVYEQKGEHEQAIRYYEKGLNIQLEVFKTTNHADIATTYNNLGTCYQRQDQYDKALEAYHKTLNIWRDVFEEEHPDMAVVYNNIGTCHYYQSDYSQALNYLHKALAIHYRLLEADHPNSGVYYNSMALCYSGKSDYDRALNYFRKALAILTTSYGNNHPIIASIYNNMGSCYEKKGDYYKAIDYYQKAMDVQVGIFGENHASVALSYNNMGVCYEKSQDYNKALLYYNKASRIQHKVFKTDHSDIAYSYNNIGVCYKQKGEYEQALGNYQEALRIWMKIFGEDHPNIALSYQNMGACYTAKKEYQQALDYHQKALAIRVNTFGPSHPHVANSYLNIGTCYSDDKKYRQALSYFQRALTVLNTSFNDEDIYTNPPLTHISSRILLLDVLKAKATTLRECYANTESQEGGKDLEFALETYLLAADLVDTLRFTYTRQSAGNLTEKVMPLYEEGIHTAFQLFETSKDSRYQDQAFTLAEKSKAFLLLQTLNGFGLKHFAGVPDSLLQHERDLKTTIAFHEEERHKARYNKDTVRIKKYEDTLFHRKRSYDRLLAHIKRHYPDYYRLKHRNVTSVKTIQKELLHKYNALIQYVEGNHTIYLFALSKDGLYTHAFPKDSAFHQQLTAFQKALANYAFIVDSTQAAYRLYSQSAWQLYQRLLAPALCELPDEVQQLLIVADGNLSAIPFEALLSREPANTKAQYSNLPYLIHRYRFQYGYSATLLWENLKRKRKTTNDRCLAFAPVYEGQAIASRSRGTLRALRSGASALPEAQKEVAAIAGHYSGTFYFGAEASEQRFKQEAANYGVIHLAMHGQANHKDPLYSRLEYTSTSDSTEDDVLYAYELYNLSLNAELVVLSACETGTGAYVRGEGVMSLARAFRYAGVPSAVMSLWKIEDKATAELMNHFYEKLSKGITKDEALQQAKQQYLEEASRLHAHPFYWAGLVSTGDHRALGRRRHGKIYWLLGSAALLIFIYVMIRYERRRSGAPSNTG